MTTVTDDLTFSLSLLMDEDDLVVDGVLSYSHPGFDDGTWYEAVPKDRKSTRLNSSHITRSRMPSSA